jgi:hypothetical protein
LLADAAADPPKFGLSPPQLNYTVNGNQVSYFYLFDVAIGREAGTLRFNTPASVAQRQHRFGMIAVTGSPEPRELPFPLSLYQSGGHLFAQSNAPAWFGRPTVRETSNLSYWDDWKNQNLVHADASPNDGVMDANNAKTNRDGGDILLTNVISFDIKVFDDDFLPGDPDIVNLGYSADPPTSANTALTPFFWPGELTAHNGIAPPSGNPALDLPTYHVNPGMPPGTAVAKDTSPSYPTTWISPFRSRIEPLSANTPLPAGEPAAAQAR